MQSTGAMLVGRNTYDVGQRDVGKPTGEPYGGAWSGPEFVLTHRPPSDVGNPLVTFLSGDIRAAVATALDAAAGKNLEVLGADVATQCLEHQLVDEVYVLILPVLLGAGVRLFTPAQLTRVNLEPVSVKQSGSLVSLEYRVQK